MWLNLQFEIGFIVLTYLQTQIIFLYFRALPDLEFQTDLLQESQFPFRTKFHKTNINHINNY